MVSTSESALAEKKFGGIRSRMSVSSESLPLMTRHSPETPGKNEESIVTKQDCSKNMTGYLSSIHLKKKVTSLLTPIQTLWNARLLSHGCV